jgi:hypothetical protein
MMTHFNIDGNNDCDHYAPDILESRLERCRTLMSYIFMPLIGSSRSFNHYDVEETMVAKKCGFQILSLFFLRETLLLNCVLSNWSNNETRFIIIKKSIIFLNGLLFYQTLCEAVIKFLFRTQKYTRVRS